MSEAPALRLVELSPDHPYASEAPKALPAALSFDKVGAVEIVAPDGYSAALLQDYAAPLFPAEIVRGSGWIVRFDPPPAGGDWVVELLALVEGWLKSVPLPCAKALQEDRSYLIRDATDCTKSSLAAGPDAHLMDVSTR
jgi:hypothetical protein